MIPRPTCSRCEDWTTVVVKGKESPCPVCQPAEKYLRRCNGRPAAGILISARDLRATLAASKDVVEYDDGTITWTATAGQFTAEPVHA